MGGFFIYIVMITKLYEYNMYNKRMKDIRNGVTLLNKEFNNKPVKFFIKYKMGRKFNEFEYNETIHNITYNNKEGIRINFKKDDTYIIVDKETVYFHERYERLPKRVLHKGETLTELIDKIRKI